MSHYSNIYYLILVVVLKCIIANHRCHYNLRKYSLISFSMKITNVWNSLPFSVVTARSVFCKLI